MSFRSRANSCEHTGETALGRFFHLGAVNSLASSFAPYAGFWLVFLAGILRRKKVLTFQYPNRKPPLPGRFFCYFFADGKEFCYFLTSLYTSRFRVFGSYFLSSNFRVTFFLFLVVIRMCPEGDFIFCRRSCDIDRKTIPARTILRNRGRNLGPYPPSVLLDLKGWHTALKYHINRPSLHDALPNHK